MSPTDGISAISTELLKALQIVSFPPRNIQFMISEMVVNEGWWDLNSRYNPAKREKIISFRSIQKLLFSSTGSLQNNIVENSIKNPLEKGFDSQNFSINSERQNKTLKRYVFHYSIALSLHPFFTVCVRCIRVPHTGHDMFCGIFHPQCIYSYIL